jgi:hypothetical protein
LRCRTSGSHVCRIDSTPVSAPRCRGSAATSRSVAALVSKSQAYKTGSVPIAKRQQGMRQGEDDVDIRYVEEFAFARAASASVPAPGASRTRPARVGTASFCGCGNSGA